MNENEITTNVSDNLEYAIEHLNQAAYAALQSENKNHLIAFLITSLSDHVARLGHGIYGDDLGETVTIKVVMNNNLSIVTYTAMENQEFSAEHEVEPWMGWVQGN